MRCRRSVVSWIVLGLAVQLAALPAAAASVAAAPLGPLVDAPGGRGEMELVRFDDALAPMLLAADPEQEVEIRDWPVTPGRRATVRLRRFDVYAPDARIVVIEDGMSRDEPRSRLAFFRGAVADGLEAGSRLVTWLDPETGRVGGFVAATSGTVLLEPARRDDREVTRVLMSDTLPESGPGLAWSCGVKEEGGDFSWREEMRRAREAAAAAHPSSVAALGTLTKTAVIAFDTDAEYLDLRFDNSASAATSHIAQLVAGMSLIYERDVASVSGDGVRILQGYTILRIGEASDPYTDTVGSADASKLIEFRDYWNANYPTTVVRRALAALLSGKQGSEFSASGIAAVGALCSTSGYSVDQLFTYPVSVTTDLGILAHEVGHNFGAYHTHSCYYGTPPIDTCVTPEGSCTPATGCPGSATFNGVTTNGTLMSYCHSVGCSPRNLVFHTRSVTDNPADPYFVDSLLQEVANAGCLASLSGGVVLPAPTVSSVSPASGPLTGGSSVTITGTNFVNGATVAFVELPTNDVFGTPSAKAASTTFVNSTQLTVTTPSAALAGAVDVVVMNPDRQTVKRASGFTYASGPPAPAVTSVSPAVGTTSGGTAVTITGSSFVAGATVRFDGVLATGVGFVSSTTLTATTPAHAAGAVNVTVTNPDLQVGTLVNGFSYGAPLISTFTANPVLIASGGASTLTWATSGATSVTLNGGAVSTSGSVGVTPTSTTTYTLVATNALGSATRSVTVNVGKGTASIGTPVITAPTAGQVLGVAGVNLSWNAVTNATGYDLRLLSSTSGATVFSGSLAGNGSTSTLLTLPNGSYLMAVRACRNGLYTDPSCGAFATRAFSVALIAPTGAPTITSPTQGATLTDSTWTFTWTAVAKADPGLSLSYEVLLVDVAAGDVPELQISVPDPNLSTIFTLHSSTQYQLKVRACQAGCGPWSTPVTFAVDLLAVPTSAPTIGSCTVTAGNSLTCTWSAVSGADAYQVQVVQPPPAGPGGGALTVAARQVSATSVTFPVPAGGATVFLSACNGDGCGPYATTDISVPGPNPSQPNLGTPMGGTVVAGPGVLFTWNRVPGDTGSNTWYRLYVQDLSRQAAALDVYTQLNYYAAYFKAEGARYDALVVANPGLPSQVVGPAQGFNVSGSSATAPTMVAPAHNSTVTAGNVQLGWSPVPGATLYEYYVGVLGGSTATARGVTPGLVAYVPLAGAAGGTDYSGIVRACPDGATCVAGSDAGWGPWSNEPGGPGVTNFTAVP